MVSTSSAAVRLLSWNDNKSSLSFAGHVRLGYLDQNNQTKNEANYVKNDSGVWSLRTRLMFTLRQYINDDLTAGAYLRATHTFSSTHAYRVTWTYADRSYGAKTYSPRHNKMPVRIDRFYTYLDSKTYGRLTLALSTGDYVTAQGSADVRDFGTSTLYLGNQKRAITYAYLDTQDRLINYTTPNLSANVPLSASVSYGDMRSQQTLNGENKRRYDTEVSGALIYQLGNLGQVQLLAAQKQVYASYTNKYATKGFQLGADLRPLGNLRVRAEVSTAKAETAATSTRYTSAGIDLSYRVGAFTPYTGFLYANTEIKSKTGAATRANNAYEGYFGTSYNLASKVLGTFNFTVFAEGLVSYTDYYKNYGTQLSAHRFAVATGLITTW
ncbi:hypothetical protein CJP74_01175 [Psittacicella melopsittaci]|uniref:Uncharacterized protein n=1 Tax=Psittacicella melopsittaci TaxID=2028576 RepID=A0A3A1Y8V6_9GAMM|nr:hypothetical protein CJP74_01175 [Psittacicella melopsittaci]